MSASHLVTLGCDVNTANCDHAWDSNASTIPGARKEGHDKQGWDRMQGLDVCSGCLHALREMEITPKTYLKNRDNGAEQKY